MPGDDPSEPYGPDRQVEIYSMGMLADQPPEYPISFEALEARAEAALSPEAFGYVTGGAGAERTVERNRTAFDRWNLVPRMLRGVEERDLSVEVLGRELTVPVLLAPIGCQSVLHEDAELAVARAASDMDVPMVLSSVSSEPMEDVAEALGSTPGWFQLYWSSDREITASFLERADAAGYEAIVLTVDTPVPGWRERDLE
jgi:isopentenyl diphosphate isomerase/L-lactate dehydrogenase-like FMN-dependent dehydrogenase